MPSLRGMNVFPSALFRVYTHADSPNVAVVADRVPAVAGAPAPSFFGPHAAFFAWPTGELKAGIRYSPREMIGPVAKHWLAAALRASTTADSSFERGVANNVASNPRLRAICAWAAKDV